MRKHFTESPDAILSRTDQFMIIRHIVAENQAPEAGSKISISGYFLNIVSLEYLSHDIDVTVMFKSQTIYI